MQFYDEDLNSPETKARSPGKNKEKDLQNAKHPLASKSNSQETSNRVNKSCSNDDQSLPWLKQNKSNRQSKKKLYALNHPFDSKEYGQKMIDKMRETIANQTFIDTKNLKARQSDHLKNIRLNRQIQNESMIFDQEFTQMALKNNKSTLLVQNNRMDKRSIRNRNINNQSIVLPELPSLEVTVKRHQIPTPKIPINYVPNSTVHQDPLHHSNFFQSKKLQEQLQQEEKQLMENQQQMSDSNTRLIAANSNTNLQSQSLHSLNKLNQVTDNSQKKLNLQENSSKLLINVPSTVTKNSKRAGMPYSFSKGDNMKVQNKLSPENIDSIIQESLQIRSFANSPDFTTDGRQLEKSNEKPLEDLGSKKRQTSKLKLIMNQKKQIQISRVTSSKQLSNGSDHKSGEDSVVNSVYNTSHQNKRKSVTDKVDFGTDVMSPNQQNATPNADLTPNPTALIADTSKSISKDLTPNPTSFDKDEDEVEHSPANDEYYTFNQQFPNYKPMKKVKRKRRKQKELSQSMTHTLTHSLKQLNQMSSKQLIKQHPQEAKLNKSILQESLRQIQRVQMARFEAQNDPQSIKRRKKYRGLYSKNDKELHNQSLETTIEIQNHVEYLRSLSPNKLSPYKSMGYYEHSEIQKKQQADKQLRASQQEFLKKFRQQHLHNQKQMQKWNGMNNNQYKLKIQSYEQNAINGLENQISVMQSEERKKFLEFVMSYEGPQSQILFHFQQKYKSLPGASQMVSNKFKKQKYKSDFRSSIYSKNSLSNSNGSGREATRINDKYSGTNVSDQKVMIQIPTQENYKSPSPIQTALSPVQKPELPQLITKNMQLQIDNSFKLPNTGQRNITEKTPIQNNKTVSSSPFQKPYNIHDENLKIDNFRNMESFDSSMKSPNSNKLRDQISHSPQSQNFKSPSLVNIGQSKYLHQSDSKNELILQELQPDVMSAGNQVNLETPTLVSPDPLKRGPKKFKKSKFDKEPIVLMKPKMIDMNLQVQLSQNTSKKLMVPKYPTISNQNIIDQIIREENQSKKKSKIEESLYSSSNQAVYDTVRNSQIQTKLTSPQTTNLNLDNIISNDAGMKGSNTQLNQYAPLNQSGNYEQNLVKFSRTNYQYQEPIAPISGQFSAGPVKKMPIIRYATKSELENSLENSHSIQQIVKQNSQNVSSKQDDQSYDNKQRIFQSLKGFTSSMSSQKKLESFPSNVQIKGVFGNTIDLKGKTPFSPKLYPSALRGISPALSPNSQDLTNILQNIQSQSESQRIQAQTIQHLNFEISQDKTTGPDPDNISEEADKTFRLVQYPQDANNLPPTIQHSSKELSHNMPTNLNNSRLESQEFQRDHQEVILVMPGKEGQPIMSGINQIGQSETPTRSVELHSQKRNMMTGKFKDVESISVSQADNESNTVRDRDLDIIREPSYGTHQTLTPNKQGAKEKLKLMNKKGGYPTQFQKIIYKPAKGEQSNKESIGTNPRIETDFTENESPMVHAQIRAELKLRDTHDSNMVINEQERLDTQNAYVTVVALAAAAQPEYQTQMQPVLKKGFRGQKYENPHLQQKLQKMMQYNMKTNFNENVGKRKQYNRTLSPTQLQKKQETSLDKIQKYKIEVLEKYKNKNQQVDQAIQFATNFSNTQNRFNQTFGDPFMNKSINDPNSQLTFLKAQQKISRSRLEHQNSMKNSLGFKQSDRDSKMSPNVSPQRQRDSQMAGSKISQKDLKFIASNNKPTDLNDTSNPNKNQEQATFSNDEDRFNEQIEPMYSPGSPAQLQENFVPEKNQETMDVSTKKTEQRGALPDDISAIDHQSILMKSHSKNPFNNTFSQQNIQTLLSNNNIQRLSEDQNENLVTMQNDDQSFKRKYSATRQSQNEIEERDSFDAEPHRKPEPESPTSIGYTRLANRDSQMMVQYMNSGGRRSKFSESQRFSPLQHRNELNLNVRPIPQNHIRDPYNPILNQSYNIQNTEISENMSMINMNHLVPNYISDQLQNQAITQSNFAKKSSFSPSKIHTKRKINLQDNKDHYRTIATSPIPEIIESKKQSMMITPANGITPKIGDSVPSNLRTEGIDKFSDGKDPQLQMFISSKNSPRGVSQDATPKKDKNLRPSQPDLQTSQKQKLTLQKQEQQKDKLKQHEKQKKSILKHQKSRAPEDIDYQLKKTFLIQSLSSRAFDSNKADFYTSQQTNSIGQRISGQTIYKNNSKERVKKKISMRMDNVPYLQQDIDKIMTNNNFFGTKPNQTITIVNDNEQTIMDQRSSMGTLQTMNTPFKNHSTRAILGKGKLIQPSPLRKLILGQQISAGQQRLQNPDDIMRQTQEIQRQVQQNTYKNPFQIEGEQMHIQTIRSQISNAEKQQKQEILINQKLTIQDGKNSKFQISDATNSLQSFNKRESRNKMKNLNEMQSTMTLLKTQVLPAGTDQVRSRDQLSNNLSYKQLTALTKKSTHNIAKNIDNSESHDPDSINRDLVQIKTPMELAPKSNNLNQTLKLVSPNSKSKSPAVLGDIDSAIMEEEKQNVLSTHESKAEGR